MNSQSSRLTASEGLGWDYRHAPLQELKRFFRRQQLPELGQEDLFIPLVAGIKLGWKVLPYSGFVGCEANRGLFSGLVPHLSSLYSSLSYCLKTSGARLTEGHKLGNRPGPSNPDQPCLQVHHSKICFHTTPFEDPTLHLYTDARGPTSLNAQSLACWEKSPS